MGENARIEVSRTHSVRTKNLASKATSEPKTKDITKNNSQKKQFTIAVVDEFEKSKSDIDLDGDGRNDYGAVGLSNSTSHGKIVESYISAKSKLPVNFLEAWTDEGIAKAFDELRAEIESGTVLDGINISRFIELADNKGKIIAIKPKAEDIANLLYPSDNSKPNNDPQNLANAKKYKALIQNIKSGALNNPQSPVREEVLKAFEISPINKEVLDAYRKLVKIAKEKGIPIVLSATNNKEQITAFSLIEPTITVGATDATGKVAKYSSKFSPVDGYAQGTYNIYKTATGFDITGDGITDIEDKDVKLTGGQSRPQLYDSKPYAKSLEQASKRDSNGKNDYNRFAEILEKYTATNKAEEIEVVNQFKGRVFSSGDLVKAFKDLKLNVEIERMHFDEYLEDKSSDQGEYIVFDGMDENGVPQFIFYRSKVNDKNVPVLFYDPANTGKAGAVGVTYGTSWSAPTALIARLNQKVSN